MIFKVFDIGSPYDRMANKQSVRYARYKPAMPEIERKRIEKKYPYVRSGGPDHAGEREGSAVSIDDVVQILRDAPRYGAERDEPEGTRYIRISETLALQMAESLEAFVEMTASGLEVQIRKATEDAEGR